MQKSACGKEEAKVANSPEVGLERIGMTRKTSQERLSYLPIGWTRRKPEGEGWGYLKYL